MSGAKGDISSQMITIAHLSDLHFGDACPVALYDAQQALLDEAPDCIVVTGDITQAGRRSEFKQAAEWFAGLRAPVVVCPGNHDAPVYSVVSRIVEPYGRFRKLNFPTNWACVEGRAAVVAWNSARAIQARLDWSQGVHEPLDVDLALTLAHELAPRGWRILACHHPPGAPSGAPIGVRTKNAAMTRAKLEASVKTVLLCGHVHHFSKEAVGSSFIVTAPTLASSREREGGRGFVLLRLDHEVMEAELRAI